LRGRQEGLEKTFARGQKGLEKNVWTGAKGAWKKVWMEGKRGVKKCLDGGHTPTASPPLRAASNNSKFSTQWVNTFKMKNNEF